MGNQDYEVAKSKKATSFNIMLLFLSLFLVGILNLGTTETIIPILGFHNIINTEKQLSSDVQGDMDYNQKDLEKLLEQLINQNYWFLSTQDLYDYFLTKSKKIPAAHRFQKPIMITFDDGYKTVYTNLIPVLSKLEKKYHHQIKVVLFINPGNLANNERLTSTHLSCWELRQGIKKGFYDIQSHGQNHMDLTRLPQKQLINELLQARNKLRKCTQDLDPDQKVASHFAYPYGAYNKEIERYVAKYYLSGYLYNDEILNHKCLRNYYQIPRLVVNRQKTTKQLIENRVKFSPVTQKNKHQTKC